MSERERVAAIALEWERTPYINDGRIKGKCADCTFFAKVFEEAGLVPEVQIPRYGPQAHMGVTASLYMTLLLRYAKREVTEQEAQIADVVMFNVGGRGWTHGGIIIPPGWPYILHADIKARAIRRDEGTRGPLASFPRRFF